ncbi:hypothetical protein RclHR1_09190007 [Rhizophagus clarus]|uniref:Uncharacterized protein n=1 Tax=Rhizophagus clarus TaxID=94130 RepID=A0A2Z6S5T0_9GLOM|nr:hypothetical protein RclHR1_09190007 [Rhizophagus clarus]GES78680.1 hypothetical protein GLOIN_2v1767629 [Rhizophagus clarus]
MDTIEDKITKITELQLFLNGRLPNINDAKPMHIYEELLSLHDNRPINKFTNMRNLARLFISRKANRIQITDFHVISRVTDLLLKSATRPEKLEYHKLAVQVNVIIAKNRIH